MEMEGLIFGTGICIIYFTYVFLSNFKSDINKKIDKLEAKLNQRDEHMFFLMTGIALSDAILNEKNKEKK